MKKRRLWPVVTGALTILALLLVLLVKKGRGGRDETFDPNLVTQVARGDLEISVVELGRIEPREKVGVKSRVAGQVDKLLVEEGMKVEKGQLLAVLDPIDFVRTVARSEQEVKKAQVALEFAELTLERRKRGLADRGVAQMDVDFADNDVKTKRILLDQAKESLAIAQDQLRFSRIVAPISGTVTQRNIRVGETVVPGSMATLDATALMTISDLSVLLVKADLNQIDVAKVRLGQAVTLTLDSLPGKTFHARVTKIAPASILPKGKDVEVFPIEATLEMSKHEGDGTSAIRPGMTADVKIHVETKKGVLKLPIEAVIKEKEKSFVTRVEQEEGKKARTVRTEVTLGARNDREQEIISGLKEADRVLIRPPSADANEFK